MEINYNFLLLIGINIGCSGLEAYVEVMESIAHIIPDSREAREQREVVWDRIATLVGRGVTTGSRMLDG